jgi:hypothetical protein
MIRSTPAATGPVADRPAAAPFPPDSKLTRESNQERAQNRNPKSQEYGLRAHTFLQKSLLRRANKGRFINGLPVFHGRRINRHAAHTLLNTAEPILF